MLESILPHQAFRKSLRGERATIPNLYDLFPEWTPRFHPDLQKAREEVLDPWLERSDHIQYLARRILTHSHSWVDEPQTRAKLRAANFTIFAAIICADASFEKLCTVAKYFAWVCSVRSYFVNKLIFIFSFLRHSILYGTTVRHITKHKQPGI